MARSCGERAYTCSEITLNKYFVWISENPSEGGPFGDSAMLPAMAGKPTIAIVGAGNLGTALAVSLRRAGYGIEAIIARSRGKSLTKARVLATQVGARAQVGGQGIEAGVMWFCVPDAAIARAAESIALRPQAKGMVALHSSGALSSRELDPLRATGVAVASAHPLMTFVAGAHPSLTGVPFAVEGDAAALRVARQMVRELGGDSFVLPATRKAAYHEWATLTSPLLLAFLVTLEEAARAAGLTRQEGRRKSLPIIRQTLENYSRLGPARSFSGPLVRGDAATVAKHLDVLKKHPGAREVYVALARAALRGLPVKNREVMAKLLSAVSP